MKRALVIAALLLLAVPVFAQKGPDTELGFQPGKLYDFTEIDSVNLYNGNLMLTVPIGPRKQVSSMLSYQIQLIYNGKVWDMETYEGCGEPPSRCEDRMPNRRSNAGLGWRVSFGRLLPPYDPTQRKSTDQRAAFVYESPAGDEHAFGRLTPTSDIYVALDSSALRLVKIPDLDPDAQIYHVEFPTGEIHRFELENGAFRLKKISDRFDNNITFVYEYANDDHRRVTKQSIIDSTLTGHVIHYEVDKDLNEGVDRGAVVNYIEYQGFGGTMATYDLQYVSMAVTFRRYGRTIKTFVPMLSNVVQPDGTSFHFEYYTDRINYEAYQGALAEVRLPTGGKTEYHWRGYTFPSKLPCNGTNDDPGVWTRTITDASPTTARTWEYVQNIGGTAPVDYPDPGGDYCCVDLHPSYPGSMPIYWLRTSVLSPKETLPDGRYIRTRTDHYFDAWSFEFDYPACSVPTAPAAPKDPWATEGPFAFGYPGTMAAPPESHAKGPLDEYGKLPRPRPADEYSVDDDGRRLTTKVYSGCTEAGDCTNGKLERSSWTKYEPHPLSSTHSAYPFAGFIDVSQRVKLSKTIYHEADDAGCNGDCYIASENGDDNGAGYYRQSVQTSNFPGSQTKTSRTEYKQWSVADVHDKNLVWLPGLYTEKSTEQGSEKRVELACFDESNGFLERHRVLTNASGPGTNDILTVFTPNSFGDIAFVEHYGGDLQATLRDDDHQCGRDLSELGRPWYKTENHYRTSGYEFYTGGIVVWSRNYDRDTGNPLNFKTIDRDVDTYTGAITATRDTAGVTTTTFGYEAKPVRLESVSPAGGAVSSYEYINADLADGKNAHVIETVSGVGGVIATNTYEFDGLGRSKRISQTLPDGNLAVTQTDYDHMGRQVSVTQPVERSEHPFADIGGYATTYTYDAFDRETKIVAPDGATTTFAYSGDRKTVRTSEVATVTNEKQKVTVTELYDDDGRLESVEEQSGPGGVNVTTTYTYDVDGNMVEAETTSNGVTQTRKFHYDGRGLLTEESHPEKQDPATPGEDFTRFSQYDVLGNAGRRTIGDITLDFTFDSVGRLTDVAGAEGPIKQYVFGDTQYYDLGKLWKAIRHNPRSSAGNIDVTEIYTYSPGTGRMQDRTTLVERVISPTEKQTIQEFNYGVEVYDEFLLPKVVRMPTCEKNGCKVELGLEKIENQRTAGYLTAVKDFAELTYHPSGMVDTVKHTTRLNSTDTYSQRHGLARPSRITFTGCTNTKPYFLPGLVTAKPNTNNCGLQVSWPPAVVCGGGGNVKYHLYRGEDLIASCITETTYLDKDVTGPNFYDYKVVAEGPQGTNGTGTCNSGELSDPRSVRVLYNNCVGQSSLHAESFNASAGVLTQFKATLSSANGYVPDEEVTFQIFGKTYKVRTDLEGVAIVNHKVDAKPGPYKYKVVYEGTLLPRAEAEGIVTVLCDNRSYALSPSRIDVGSLGGRFPTFVITSDNCSWQPIPDDPAIAYPDPDTGDEGTGDFDAVVTSSGTSRTTTFLVGFNRLRIKQASQCSFEFDPALAYLPAQSGRSGIDIAASPGCSWTVTKDVSWIRFDGETSGIGPGRIEFFVDSNQGGERRVGHLFIDGPNGGAKVAVNQSAPPIPSKPVLRSNLTGGGSLQNGQYASMRIWVEGSPLYYRWFINNIPQTPCEDCDAKVLAPGDAGYPSPGHTSTFQVEVYNDKGYISSQTISFTNIGDSGGCKVPTLMDSLFRTNDVPFDGLSSGGGSRVRLFVIATDPAGDHANLEYQWYEGQVGDRERPIHQVLHDGTINGIEDQVDVWPHDETFYWVEVKNACGAQFSRTSLVHITRPPKGRAVGKDFSTDGQPDILWVNQSGDVELWSMYGTAYQRTIDIRENRPSADAKLQTVGDLDGDERPDILWRDPETGHNNVWIMGWTNVDGTTRLDDREDDDPAWTMGAAADFDGDGREDIVWHNERTGENEIWFQNGTEHAGTWALPNSPSGSWGLHGAADFNKDKKIDLYFYDSATGDSSVWIMDDAERSFASAGIGTASTDSASSKSPVRREIKVATQAVTRQTDPNLVPVMVADMSHDGYPDILWRNKSTGALSIWKMKNNEVLETPPPFASRDLTWEVGGGGSTNSGDTGGTGPGGTTVTTLEATAAPASAGSVAIVNATLKAGANGLAAREVVFSLNGSETSRLLTDETGAVTAGIRVGTLAPGTHAKAITVAFAGDNTYAASSASIDLVINAAPATVTWATPAPIVYGTPLSAAQLSATADVPGTFVYDPPAGTVLATGHHTLSVTFTPSDASRSTVTSSVVLLVNQATSSVTWATPAAIAYGTPLSEAQLNATSALTGTFTYDPPAGTILAVGTQTLRVTFEPGNLNFAPSSTTTTIEVTKGEQLIRWEDPAPMSFGDPLGATQLNAVVITSGTAAAGALTYEPAAGTVLPEGVHELKVTAAETTSYRSATAVVDVVVIRPSSTITWTNPAPIVYGTALSATQLNATATVPGTFTYTPPAGTILQAGTERLAVLFTPADSRYQPASATVTIQINKARPTATWATPAPIVYGTSLSEAQLNATANIPGEFAYTPKLEAILDAGRHELTATLVPADVRNYESVTVKVFLDVARAPQTITWPSPAAIVYGTPLSATQLNATVQVVGPSPAGALTYTPALGTVLQAGSGQILTANVAGTANYDAATATVSIDVLKATPVLSWATPAPIVYKTLLSATQLNATANVPGSFQYAPPAGTLLEAGMHTLTASFTPSDTRNYNDASTTVEIEVQRADPVLAWTKPQGIVYGTALSSTQLNATADVPGTFDYTPPAGTILNAGDAQTLSVHFTPADRRNYNDAEASTTIDVAKAPQTIVWATPAPIVYGTALSAAQLNATTEVVGPAPAGALTYTPAAGTVLDAGLGQTLSVSAAETANYLPAGATVKLDVLRKALTLVVDPKSKLYGGVVPELTGTLTGVVNNDPITPSYATTATQQSVTGTYPITATLVDPNNRLVNYDVTITPSTLTVLPAPLVIAANPASKQYSDPLPVLTPTFTGFVLGETPAVLTGILSIQTTAERLSAPGTYPITIGGLTSTNYAITYVGSTFTVTPEDARVVITSPSTVSAVKAGLTTVTLAATVQDISATPDAAGDVDAGDIRKATLTFVDRATNTALCTAPIGLLAPSDERTGVATCSFTRDFGTVLPATLTVGARVAAYYTRDAAADDLAMTVATPTPDAVNGSANVEIATAAGAFAPQTGTTGRFVVNLQYDQKGVVKGNFTWSFTRTVDGVARQYELTAAPSSLSIRRATGGGVATIAGTGTLRDVTSRSAATVIASAAPLVVTLTDAGEPASNDAFNVVLYNAEGGLWLATGWNGLRAVDQRLREGNIVVVYGK